MEHSHSLAYVLVVAAIVLAVFYYFPRSTGMGAAPVARPMYQPISLGGIVVLAIIAWLIL